jgi:hypothetical protein
LGRSATKKKIQKCLFRMNSTNNAFKTQTVLLSLFPVTLYILKYFVVVIFHCSLKMDAGNRTLSRRTVCDPCGLIIETWLKKEICVVSRTYTPPKYVLERPNPQWCFNQVLHAYFSGVLQHRTKYISFEFQAASTFRNFVPVHTNSLS